MNKSQHLPDSSQAGDEGVSKTHGVVFDKSIVSKREGQQHLSLHTLASHQFAPNKFVFVEPCHSALSYRADNLLRTQNIIISKYKTISVLALKCPPF